MTNGEAESVVAQVLKLFAAMHVDVPSAETDLFDSGILDSQRLVELLFQIELHFDTEIGIEDFEIENFRCIEKIASLILQRKGVVQVAPLRAAARVSGLGQS
jgi:acyl carrier protein